MNEIYRYVRCGCKAVWRYRGRIIKKGKCPRCKRLLWEGEPVSKGVWRKALDIEAVRFGKKWD